MATVSVRCIVDDVDSAIAFYTGHLGFRVDLHPGAGLRQRQDTAASCVSRRVSSTRGFLGSWPCSSSHEKERALGPPAQILFGDANGKPRHSSVRRESFQMAQRSTFGPPPTLVFVKSSSPAPVAAMDTLICFLARPALAHDLPAGPGRVERPVPYSRHAKRPGPDLGTMTPTGGLRYKVRRVGVVALLSRRSQS